MKPPGPAVQQQLAWIKDHVLVAPMVRGSELAFRSLLRRYYPGITCYTPMLPATVVCKTNEPDTEADFLVQQELLQTPEAEKDTPLVVQLCGNNPQVLQKAATRILTEAPHVTGIDFNLGCPQNCAEHGNYGAFLAQDRALECIRALREAIDPGKGRLSAKLRLQSTCSDTIDFVKALQDAGCDQITLHCRPRDAKFDGIADLDQGKRVVEALKIPVAINGPEVSCLDDVRRVIQYTGCAQVMLARPLLMNPGMLLASLRSKSAVEWMLEYLECAKTHPVPDSRFLHLHIRWMLRPLLDPPKKFEPIDGSNWKHRLWSFIHQPYLVHWEQWRDMVRMYASLAKEDIPERFAGEKGVDPPTFKSIRNYGKEAPVADSTPPAKRQALERATTTR